MNALGNKTRNIFKFSESAYLWIIGFFAFIIMLYDVLIGAIGIGVLIILIYYHVKETHYRKGEIAKYIEGLSNEFDYVTQDAVFNLPMPLLLVRLDGRATWYNPKFKEMVARDEILGEKVSDIIPEFKVNKFTGEKKPHGCIRLKFENSDYKVFYNIVAPKEEENIENQVLVTYWVDETEYQEMKMQYEDDICNVAILQIDNYDEVLNDTAELKRPLVLAEIEKTINEFAKEMDAAIRRFEKGKYLIVFENKYLKMLEDRKFDIIDSVREIDSGSDMPFTISMGVGVGAGSINQSFEFAKAGIDIALGRGGDQVVLKSKDKLSFYGGKTRTVEKRAKVKARVIAHALKQLVDQTDEVFIMGHKVPDMDCFGAAIGLYRAVKSRGKIPYIVLDGVNPAIQNVYEEIKETSPELFKALISPEEAIYRAKRDSLCVVVDIHRPSRVEVPELLDIIDKKVVIDHHRRSSEFIEDPVLLYLEPYASSTCELVTEVLSYYEDKLKIEKIEAEALLSGIIVDTKYFTFNTGVRTFEAASFLRRSGADTTDVRQMFQDDYSTVLLKADLIKQAEIIDGKIAIAAKEFNTSDSVLVAAQTADDLLRIKGIGASFVLVKKDNKVHISGRSYGDINVQVILEKLGGGGHLTVAGAQLEDVGLDEATRRLMNAMSEYMLEGDE